MFWQVQLKTPLPENRESTFIETFKLEFDPVKQGI